MKCPDKDSCLMHEGKMNRAGQDKKYHFFIQATYLCSLLAFLVFLFPPAASGQTYFFDNYGVADGLSQSTVYKIIQDRQHKLWLGTQSGVSVFDGMVFQNYSTEDGLAINGVRAICETSDGTIWLGHTGGGISRFASGNFRQVDLPGVRVASDITSIFEDGKGNLWILTAGEGAIRLTGYSGK
nr:two-component regulator propeller domain-containing protein [Bacteroidales bacterium]